MGNSNGPLLGHHHHNKEEEEEEEGDQGETFSGKRAEMVGGEGGGCRVVERRWWRG